ncbi:MAG TPA: multiheme c-type cytochrome [Polyangia bacterium]|nr:multiheme c-type cytochrome [Polyangia bacterium]
MVDLRRRRRPGPTAGAPGWATAQVIAWALCWLPGCGTNGTSGFDHRTVQDPEACQGCHPQHYLEWAGSMHAYAGDDPVFRAMNRRAQREDPATGTFCVQCHAPVAAREGLTRDGLNLDDLPASKRGVTCYFCHATASLPSGQLHNDPLVLATDGSLFGPIADPDRQMPHQGRYSALLDGATVASATMCGSCHDIQNLQGAHVERTFREWKTTVFAGTKGGSGCAQCHMPGRDGPASAVTARVRRVHSHAFPAVDLAAIPFPAESPQNDAQRAGAQELLDRSLQSTWCLNPLTNRIELTLDNIGAGHSFPSGATPDRRLWIEVTASAGGQVIYSSGGAQALPLEGSPDPDLWLIRDCLYDAGGGEVKMFWQPATTLTNALPGTLPPNVADPCSYSVSHVKRVYPDPASSPPLAQAPDRVTIQVHLRAIGADVLDDLVGSGDLDAAVPAGIAQYDVGGGAAVDWNASASAAPTCFSSTASTNSTVPAVSHARCTPPPAAPTCAAPGT